jgi:Flp pilus assembly protein TadG
MSASRACTRGEASACQKTKPDRRGNIILLTAFLMVIMMAMLALAVDVGYVYTMQAQLQRQVDAAALAGAGDLIEGIDEAQETAREYMVRNPVGSSTSVIDESALDDAIIEFETEHGDNLDMKVGNWNPVTRTFEETPVMPSTLKVTMTYPDLPFFFARVLGHEDFTLSASSTAMFQPRDIMVVLDFSASMNDDSTFAAIGKLPQATVEQSLLNCWNDLDVTYGNLPATPTWATVHGVPQNVAALIPHVTVEYRHSSVYITSTQSLTQVKVEFSNGAQQTWNLTGTTGTFTGSGTNAGKQVRRVWVKSWSNYIPFGTNGEYFDFTSTNINATLKNALGLNLVSYPYPGYGSWDAWIDHVESSSTENASAGYRYKFGGMNLVEWWLTNYPENYKTPNQWKCRAEPVYALKDATDVFMDFIQAVDTNDRVGLVIYNGSNGEATLEHSFTDDFNAIVNTVNHRQAGHYHQYTNIGAGMTLGRQTLDSDSRPHAYKMMVLMTDGLANWHAGSYDLAGAAQQIANETALCAQESRKYKVMTISLGVDADTDTMQAVADGTGGQHFNVPGGSDYVIMHQQLYDAFDAIAKARPIKLVQ